MAGRLLGGGVHEAVQAFLGGAVAGALDRADEVAYGIDRHHPTVGGGVEPVAEFDGVDAADAGLGAQVPQQGLGPVLGGLGQHRDEDRFPGVLDLLGEGVRVGGRQLAGRPRVHVHGPLLQGVRRLVEPAGGPRAGCHGGEHRQEDGGQQGRRTGLRVPAERRPGGRATTGCDLHEYDATRTALFRHNGCVTCGVVLRTPDTGRGTAARTQCRTAAAPRPLQGPRCGGRRPGTGDDLTARGSFARPPPTKRRSSCVRRRPRA